MRRGRERWRGGGGGGGSKLATILFIF